MWDVGILNSVIWNENKKRFKMKIIPAETYVKNIKLVY